jgi:hypothetical protein
MLTFTVEQLTAMKPQFIDWLETDWCTCIADRAEDFADPPTYDPTNTYWLDCDQKRRDGHPCHCYGRHEYDEVYLAEISDKAIVIYYGERTLTLPFDDDDSPPADCNDSLPLLNRRLGGEPFITCDDLQWVGDDVDYYGPIIHWLAELHA